MNPTQEPDADPWRILNDYFEQKGRERKAAIAAMPEAVRQAVLDYERITEHSYDDKLASAQHEFARRQRQEAGAGFVD